MHKKNKTMFSKLIIPIAVAIIVEAIVFFLVLSYSGLMDIFTTEALGMFSQRLFKQSNALERELITKSSNIDKIVFSVNQKVEKYLADNSIDINKLTSSEKNYTPLMLDISSDIIDMIRANSVTGGYIILNTTSLDVDIEYNLVESKPCIYIRDYDPTKTPDEGTSDLLLNYGPNEVLKALNLATDIGWQPEITFTDNSYYSFFYSPYQQASKRTNANANNNNLGYWGKNYNELPDISSGITYSVPLILSDGTVYGVLGIDLTLDYIAQLIPFTTLSSTGEAAYVLANKSDENTFYPLVTNSSIYLPISNKNNYMQFTPSEHKNFLSYKTENESLTAKTEFLNLYNENSPYANNQLTLIGMVRDSEPMLIQQKLIKTLLIFKLCLLIIILLVVTFLAFKISRPIAKLAKKVSGSNPLLPIELPRLNIAEIDTLTSSIEHLSDELYEFATKYSNILKMASVKIAVFEFNNDSLFISDNFFEVLPISNRIPSTLTVDEFKSILNKIQGLVVNKTVNESTLNYKKNGRDLWIRLKMIYSQDKTIGLIEDITEQTLAISKLSRERDIDPLTNLLNRRAFLRQLDKLFVYDKDKLGISAMIMMDIDNLKFINDNYGHDYGDIFIHNAAEIINRGLYGSNCIVSRISGDEFYAFLYGYSSKDEINKYISNLKSKLLQAKLDLPQNPNYKIRLSGGISWYPDDSSDYSRLMTYADFAMYNIKHTEKGEFAEFNKDIYDSTYYLLSGKENFNTLIENEMIEYHFQPIVDVSNGLIYAYEALMRSKHSFFKSPTEILKMAESEAKLRQIETLTLFKALDSYKQNIEAGNIEPNCCIFVNSISNQIMSNEKSKEFVDKFSDLFENLVIEITENAELSLETFNKKCELLRPYNAKIAIDDYGTGYNGEYTLIHTNPNFVKIDMFIIRDINTDISKQALVENLVEFCHNQNIKIIAEGVETYNEMETLINLGVDYLQGYYLAKPALVPPKIPETVEYSIKYIYRHKPSK